MEDTRAPESGSPERGALEGYSDPRIVAFPPRSCTRHGLRYRAPRSVADFSRAIHDALDREATLREQAGTPDQWLRDCAAWVSRGALP